MNIEENTSNSCLDQITTMSLVNKDDNSTENIKDFLNMQRKSSRVSKVIYN